MHTCGRRGFTSRTVFPEQSGRLHVWQELHVKSKGHAHSNPNCNLESSAPDECSQYIRSQRARVPKNWEDLQQAGHIQANAADDDVQRVGRLPRPGARAQAVEATGGRLFRDRRRRRGV